MKLFRLISLLAAAGALQLAAVAPAADAAVRAARLRCEYLVNPLGLDERVPRFYWELRSGVRGEAQTAYQVIVSSTRDLAGKGKGDLWDSGKVSGSQSQHVEYAGKPLASRTAGFWRVRVWDGRGTASAFSETAVFEVGLATADWTASWIGLPSPEPPGPLYDLAGASWCWFPEGNPVQSAPAGRRFFRRRFDLPVGTRPERAVVLVSVDNDATVFLNGGAAGTAGGWQTAAVIDVRDRLREGQNVLAIAAGNASEGPAGLIARFVAYYADGTSVVVTLNEDWKCRAQEEPGWEKSEFDDGAWVAVKRIAQLGAAPWGQVKVGQPTASRPAAYLRKEFAGAPGLRRARLYATALGVFEIQLNGERVGDDVLAPGWTDYRKRAQYVTYDVTERIRAGKNVVGAVVADGWYAGSLGFDLSKNHFGPSPPRLRLQLELEFADGRRLQVVSDQSWLAATGPIREADLYGGEVHDARLELSGWTDPAVVPPGKTWQAVTVYTDRVVEMNGLTCPPIRVTGDRPTVAVTEPTPGTFVFDVGVNMVGVARLRAKAPAGTRIRLRFAEILNPDGTIYRDNLRMARAEDVYITRGEGTEIWEPRFTYHGFRYVEVTGYPGRPDEDLITGRVFHSDLDRAGSLETGVDLVDRLHANIYRGQQGNLMSVPTDCPQRDERLGWMGDAQVFAWSACWNMDMAPFWTKWMRDIADSQSEAGAFSDVSPRVVDLADGAPAWADAGIVIPWTQWLYYGDRRLIQRYYPAMRKYVDLLVSANPDLLWLKRRNNDFGDWVAAGENTNKDLIASAYLAWDLRVISESAAVLGQTADAARYGELAKRSAAAYNQRFLDADGRYRGDTQTAYAMSLGMGLVPADRRAQVSARLLESVRRRGNHLATGFIGTRFLLPALSDSGEDVLAYRLLLNRTFPSWGYMIDKGATTIWELWNSDTQGPAMNSRNHFAFGTVAEWMQRYLLGVDLAEGSSGYRRISIRPRVAPGIPGAKGDVGTLYGTIHTDWRVDGDTLRLEVGLPTGTTGVVYLPKRGAGRVTVSEGGRTLWRGGALVGGVRGVRTARDLGTMVMLQVDSGRYDFRVAPEMRLP